MSWSELVALYRIHDDDRNLRPRYNIAPTQDVLAVRLNPAGERETVDLRWGLMPFWAKDEKISYSTINARAETVASAPAFNPVDFRLIFVPFGHYDEPEILRYVSPLICPIGADVKHAGRRRLRICRCRFTQMTWLRPCP